MGWFAANQYSLLAPPIALVLVMLALDFGPTRVQIDRLENITADLRMHIRNRLDPVPANPDLQVIGIEEGDLRLFGRWPWTRRRHAELLRDIAVWSYEREKRLAQAGAPPEALQAVAPKVIAFDLLFPEQETPEIDAFFGEKAASLPVVTGAFLDYADTPQPTGDTSVDIGRQSDAERVSEALEAEGDFGAQLGAKALNTDNYGFTEPFTRITGNIDDLTSSYGAILPVPQIVDSSYIGFVDTRPDPDGVRRRIPLVVNVAGKVFPSLTLQSLMAYWNLSADNVEIIIGKEVVLRDKDKAVLRRIPISAKGDFQLNWRPWRDRVQNFGYTRLSAALAIDRQTGSWPDGFSPPSGKIMLVGQVAEGLSDFGSTPLSSYDPLVFTHATAINNILSEDYIEPVPFRTVAVIWLVVSWATLFLLRRGNVDIGFVMPLLVCLGVAFIATLLFAERNTIFALFWPLTSFMAIHTGAVFLRWKEESDAKRKVRDIFGTFAPGKVIDRMLQHPDDIKLGGDSKSVAILFSDIRGFTTLSESMTEQELVAQLNEYFERMVHCIDKYEGTLHKYIGDAVMAAWGDLTDYSPERVACDAVRSALEMIDELDKLNARWVSQGRLPWSIGLGINYGIAMVGLIGAAKKREYTLIGDPVNAASRMEGSTKEFGVKLLIGETVKDLLTPDLITRPVGLIVFKGKTQPLRMYEVMADRLNPREGQSLHDLSLWLPDYERAFELYLGRKFAEAEPLFAKCLAGRPGDKCCTLYLAACQEFQKSPPDENWDGVYVMKTK